MYDVTSVVVSAKTSNANATVESVKGGENLSVGANKIQIVVKAENGVTATYTITVTRKESGDTTDDNEDEPEPDNTDVPQEQCYDIGVVTMTGRLVKLQIKKANLKSADDIKRVYRIAKPVDMEKYHEAKSREHDTMIQSRQIAKELGLQMKIGDVEYQGDGNKAIFYYIADERVDFRQLIKVLADTFHVRIEM